MARIAIIDLLFNWPPDGGARTDIQHVATGLAKTHDIVLFCPDFRLGFPRGKVAQSPGFAVRKIPFKDYEFQPFTFARRFRAAIDEFKPDYVFVADGWYFKPYVVDALKGYKRLLRFYAHESICPKSHGHFIDNRMRQCERNWLNGWKDFLPCVQCAREWLEEYPANTHFSIPFNRGLVFLPQYPHLVRRAIASVDLIICYNDYIAGKLRPINPSIQITPSGIDAENFAPSAVSKNGAPYRILMCGRKGDPLKGYEVLFRAVAPLAQAGLEVELFVTEGPARKDGFINYTGWLDQKG
ncbi:MAG: glycosyltransferase, partial [Candidatus Coatesbacteria bacterium]|nr:glycosyltransferase [Candidatus Coatesbacteria bacterium]